MTLATLGAVDEVWRADGTSPGSTDPELAILLAADPRYARRGPIGPTPLPPEGGPIATMPGPGPQIDLSRALDFGGKGAIILGAAFFVMAVLMARRG